MSIDRQSIVDGLQRTYGTTREDAERAADRMLGSAHRANGGAPRPPTPEEIEQLEKIHEHEGDKLLLALGFEVVRFSRPGKTKQTPGIADRRAYHRRRQLTFWWEVKADWGEQSPDQKVFQEMVEACGEPYVLGTVGVLRTWLAGRRVCAFGVDNTPIPLPIEDQVRCPSQFPTP